MFEPWDYKSVCEASRWYRQFVRPIVGELILLLNQRNLQAWENLARLKPNHGDFTELRKVQARVRDVWYKRPRFKNEKGRVKKQGY